MKTVGLTVLGIGLLLVLATAAFIYSGAYNVAANEGHTGFGEWVLQTTQERSIAARARRLDAPPPADSAMLAHGFEHFHAMCVVCHGAPGLERGEIGAGLTPLPPELSEAAEDFDSREIYWIVRNGIKLAGMPAFGATHADADLWGIVAFVEQLPEMSADDYQEWVERYLAAGQEGGDGHEHAPGTPAHSH
jgi:mono/diheme cytochrome c family protein